MHAPLDAALPSQRRSFAFPERYRDSAMCVGVALVGLLLAGLAIHFEAGVSRTNGTSWIAAAEGQSQPGLFTGVP
jgi:hypothetical protein